MIRVLAASSRVVTLITEKSIFFYFVFAALLVGCFYSIANTSVPVITYSAKGLKGLMGQFLTLKIIFLIFGVMYYNSASRLKILGFGCISLIAAGFYVGFYDFNYAFRKINASTLSLLFGMGLISIILDSTNCFKVITNRLIEKYGRYHFALFAVLMLLTYSFSLFINNLTTMLLILPVTLTLTDKLKLKPAPFVIGQIIASNLGGASSMIGDFPNILLSSTMNIRFYQFIKHMMPICLINLGITFWYFYSKVDLGSEHRKGHNPIDLKNA